MAGRAAPESHRGTAVAPAMPARKRQLLCRLAVALSLLGGAGVCALRRPAVGARGRRSLAVGASTSASPEPQGDIFRRVQALEKQLSDMRGKERRSWSSRERDYEMRDMDPMTHYLMKPEKEVSYEQARVAARVLCAIAGCLLLSTVSRRLWALGSLGGLWVCSVLLDNTGTKGAKGGGEAGDREDVEYVVSGPASEALLLAGARVAFYYVSITDILREMAFLWRSGRLGYTMVKRYQALEQRYNIEERTKVLSDFASRTSSGVASLDARLQLREKVKTATNKSLEGLSNSILILRASLSDSEELKRKISKRERVKSISNYLRRALTGVFDLVRGVPNFILLLLGVEGAAPYKRRGRPAGSGAANEQQFFRSLGVYAPRTPSSTTGAPAAPQYRDLQGAPLVVRSVQLGLGWGLGLFLGFRIASRLLGANPASLQAAVAQSMSQLLAG